MNRQSVIQPQPGSVALTSGGILQRKCACGQHTGGSGECAECRERKKRQQDNTNAMVLGEPAAGSPMDHHAFRKSRFGHDFSLVPLGLHNKLTVSRPDDPFEREADRVAERVVSAIDTKPESFPVASTVAGTFLQRQESEGDGDIGDGDEMEDELAETDESILTGDETGRPKLEPGIVGGGQTVSVLLPRGPGRSLDEGTRGFMERRIGHDFSRVRIHNDAEASASAQRLDAEAYTIGTEIYFNQGHYNPESHAGKRLLAHELVHVVQQTGHSQATADGFIQRKGRAGRRPRGPRDAPRDQGQHRRRGSTGARFCKKRDGRNCAVPCGPASCNDQCTNAVNRFTHNPCCGNETCAGSGPANTASFIRHLDVNLSTQMVEAEVGNRASTISVVGPFLSSPNPSVTPQGSHTIDVKCGPCHTNCDGHGMAWFAGFHNGLEFGFHNSQRVASGVHSLGCVRVPCGRAQWIHDNTWSGVTSVCVHTGGHCNRRRPRRPSPGGTPPAEAPRSTRPAVSQLEPSVAPEGAPGGEEEIA